MTVFTTNLKYTICIFNTYSKCTFLTLKDEGTLYKLYANIPFTCMLAWQYLLIIIKH